MLVCLQLDPIPWEWIGVFHSHRTQAWQDSASSSSWLEWEEEVKCKIDSEVIAVKVEVFSKSQFPDAISVSFILDRWLPSFLQILHLTMIIGQW